MLDSVIHQKQCHKPVSEYCSGHATIPEQLVPSFLRLQVQSRKRKTTATRIQKKCAAELFNTCALHDVENMNPESF